MADPQGPEAASEPSARAEERRKRRSYIIREWVVGMAIPLWAVLSLVRALREGLAAALSWSSIVASLVGLVAALGASWIIGIIFWRTGIGRAKK